MILTIKHGKLIEPFIEPFISQKYPDFVFHTKEAVEAKIELFKKVELDSLIAAACEFTGLEFKRKDITCYIVNSIDRDMSSPLIMKSGHSVEKFRINIIHELLHCLFSDNRFPPKIAGENNTVSNHIPVFAVMRHLGLESVETNPDYKKAWDLSETYKFPTNRS